MLSCSGGLRQAFAVLVTSQVLVCLGTSIGLHTVMLIQVPREPERFLTDEQLNWTISVTMLGALLGALVSVPAAAPLGARRLLLLSMPLHALGALAAALGDSFGWVLSGRLMMAAVVGAVEGPARAYMAEAVPPQRRALVATALNAAISVGQVAVQAAGPWLPWQTLMLVAGCAPPAVCLAGLLLLPDSAGWLLTRGIEGAQQAHKTLHFFRPHADAAAELTDVHGSGAASGVRPGWQRLWRPLVLSGAPLAVLCWCGGSALLQVAPLILESVSLPLDSHQRALALPVLTLLLCAPALPLVDRFGRLPLLRLGGCLSAGGCITISAHFFLSADLQLQYGWLTLAGAVPVLVAHCCLLAPVLFSYAAELMPSGFRDQGAIIAITGLNVSTFVLLKTYPAMNQSLGLQGTFLVHAAASLLLVLLASTCLVETRGLSLEQISELFAAKTDSSETNEPPASVAG